LRESFRTLQTDPKEINPTQICTGWRECWYKWIWRRPTRKWRVLARTMMTTRESTIHDSYFEIRKQLQKIWLNLFAGWWKSTMDRSQRRKPYKGDIYTTKQEAAKAHSKRSQHWNTDYESCAKARRHASAWHTKNTRRKTCTFVWRFCLGYFISRKLHL
jgi:hypothetical protein